jgi:hypothetical protein
LVAALKNGLSKQKSKPQTQTPSEEQTHMNVFDEWNENTDGSGYAGDLDALLDRLEEFSLIDGLDDLHDAVFTPCAVCDEPFEHGHECAECGASICAPCSAVDIRRDPKRAVRYLCPDEEGAGYFMV